MTDLPRPVPSQVKCIDDCMTENDELTARLVRGLLVRKWLQVDVSVSTILKNKCLRWRPMCKYLKI